MKLSKKSFCWKKAEQNDNIEKNQNRNNEIDDAYFVELFKMKELVKHQETKFSVLKLAEDKRKCGS